MKYYIIVFYLFLFCSSNAQMRMNDPSIVHQEKRQVYDSWGNWYPKPKYFLGVQTNFAYATVWGNWAPARNRRYRRGEDIRPLKAGGLEMQTYSQVVLMQEQTDKLMKNTEEWLKVEQNEFLNVTNVTAVADPLYLVYYKPNLKSLEEFNPHSIFYRDWGFFREKAFREAFEYGMIKHYAEMILDLQDQYEIAKGVNVARGKRLLLYHDIFLEWRSLRRRIKDLENTFHLQDLAKSELMKWKQATRSTHTRSDEEIFREALNQSNIF